MTILTGGLFLPFWMLASLGDSVRPWICQTCGSRYKAPSFKAPKWLAPKPMSVREKRFLVGCYTLLLGPPAVIGAWAFWYFEPTRDLASRSESTVGTADEDPTGRATNSNTARPVSNRGSEAGATDQVRRAQLLDALSKLDPTGTLFDADRCAVTGTVGEVVVNGAWATLPKERRLEVVHAVTAAWSAIWGSDKPDWMLRDQAERVIGGWSAAQGGEYLLDD